MLNSKEKRPHFCDLRSIVYNLNSNAKYPLSLCRFFGSDLKHKG